jgi:glucose/arabinose dehydrogenase
VPDARFVTALAWSPDGRLFFAERAGTVRIAAGDVVTTFATVPTVTTERDGGYSERGLLGLALSPSFSTDHFVYAFYSRDDHRTQAVVRWRECRGAPVGLPQTLVELPSGDACCHKGGRIAFGPDGKLYVSLGDELSVPPPPGGPSPPVPQDFADVRGKILRYNPDGTIPSDNPNGPANPVWVAGVRNVYGLAWDGAGGVWVVDNGPTGDAGSPTTGFDIVFRAGRGGRYQWPYCYGAAHLIPPYSSCGGAPAPDWSSESRTLIPTGAVVVDARGPAGLAGHLVFATTVEGLEVFEPGPPATVSAGDPGCRFDVVQGPDGAVYCSDETSIYRLG